MEMKAFRLMMALIQRISIRFEGLLEAEAWAWTIFYEGHVNFGANEFKCLQCIQNRPIDDPAMCDSDDEKQQNARQFMNAITRHMNSKCNESTSLAARATFTNVGSDPI